MHVAAFRRSEEPEPGVRVGRPTWHTGDRSWAKSVRRGASKLAGGVERWVICRGDKIAYLRRRGVRIGPHTAILGRVEEFGTEPWLIEIGARVTIAAGVVFVTHDGSSRVFRHVIEGGSSFGNCFAPIRVLDGSFVGLRSILMPGVTIGPNAIVGAGSVVTRDVAPETVVAGVPARPLGTLDAFVAAYRAKMIPGLSSDRSELRRQLTRRFWGHER